MLVLPQLLWVGLPDKSHCAWGRRDVPRSHWVDKDWHAWVCQEGPSRRGSGAIGLCLTAGTSLTLGGAWDSLCHIETNY